MKLVSLALALGALGPSSYRFSCTDGRRPGGMRHGARHAGAHAAHRTPTRGRGGYSLTLRDVWGPAKMPPPPEDFGPHFDFPPEPLNGGLNHDPYPN